MKKIQLVVSDYSAACLPKTLIGIFANLGMEHNFQEYTKDEVKTLQANKDFYDYDVSTSARLKCRWYGCTFHLMVDAAD